MIDSIQEIRKALDKDCYLAALALSLTLPDICSQVENAVMDENRTLYINWFNSHANMMTFIYRWQDLRLRLLMARCATH